MATERLTYAELFQKIEELRQAILVSFTRIDSEDMILSSSETLEMKKLRQNIEKYETYVGALPNIEDALTHKFPLRRPDGSVTISEFPRAALENRYEMWMEDAQTFGDRYRMFCIRYALVSDSAAAEARRRSISLAYNQVTAVKQRVSKGMTPDLLQKILTKSVFIDDMDHLEIFKSKEKFFNSLVFGSPAQKTIQKEVDGFLIGMQPRSEADIEFKKAAVKELAISSTTVTESLGFMNPFDNLSSSTFTTAGTMEDENTPTVSYKYDDYGNKIVPSDPSLIRKVCVYDSSHRGNVIYTKHNGESRVAAGRSFFPGDVIEICPIKIMEEKDLYSKNIRESVFPIDDKQRLFAIPLGNALCYRNDMEAKGLTGNVRYEYDESNDTIKIIATRKIKKGNELLFHADDSDFANELHPYDFRYDKEPAEIVGARAVSS